jgi:uncharacterized membrane protein YhhN
MRGRLVMLAFALAAMTTCVEALGFDAAVYVFKPLATLALAILAYRAEAPATYRRWITVGLLASLAGDILLMLPGTLFVPGLAAFLVAHLCYITAFANDGAGVRAPLWPALPIIALAAMVLTYLWPSLGALRVPVVCYIAVISTMAWQANARWLVQRTPGAAFAAVGSVFFLASDSSLAIRKFHGPFAGATLVVLITYYAAQWGLMFSVRTDETSAATR